MLSERPAECPAELLQKAQQLPACSTAIVNAATPLVMESARGASLQGLLDPVLIGNSHDIRRIAREMDWGLDSVRIIEAASETGAAEIAVSLVRNREIQSLMKGDIHTHTLLRTAFDRTSGIRTRRRPSHVFYMSVPGHCNRLCITDAVINVLPRVRVKVDIAKNAIDLLHSLEIERPRVAVLSAVESPNPQMPSSVEAEQVADIVGREIDSADIDGPLSLDVAVSESAANIKAVKSEVAGNADVLLVPNIESGNFLFKQMVYFMGATAAGIVLGASVPIMLTSRADPVVARIASAALASIHAFWRTTRSQ